MMEAIITRFCPPTETRKAHIVARCSKGCAIVDRNPDVPRDANHALALERLARELNWCGRWVGAYLPDGRMVWVPAVGRVIDVSSEE